MLNINKCKNNNVIIYKSSFDFNINSLYFIKIENDLTKDYSTTKLVPTSISSQYTAFKIHDVYCDMAGYNNTAGEVILQNTGYHTLYILDQNTSGILYTERINVKDNISNFYSDIDVVLYENNEENLIVYDKDEQSFCQILEDCNNFKDVKIDIESLKNSIGKDYTTAGLATINYVDNSINNLNFTNNDYTTAGLASIDYVNNSIENLNLKDYSTAGLASIDYVNDSIENLNLKDYSTAGLVYKVNNINPISGNVTITTSNISEGSNLYYTDVRVNNNTNVIKGVTAFNYGNHSTAGYVKKVNNINPVNGNVTLTTSNITEGSNFYFTTARVNSNINVGKGLQAFNWGNHSTSGYVKKVNNINPVSGNVTLTTTNIIEGSNLYFTTARTANKWTKGGNTLNREEIFGGTSGNFGIDVRTNGLTSVKFLASSSGSVNYMTFKSNITGTSPTIGVAGDANLSINYVASGTGLHKFTGAISNNSIPYSPFDFINGTLTTYTTPTLSGCSNTLNSNLITVPSTATIRIGDVITGTGIPAGTYVMTIMSSTTLSMSAIATSTNASFVLTITKPQIAKYISFTPNITNTKIGGLVLDNGVTTTPNLTLCRNVQTNGSPYISILDSGNNNGNTYFNWLTVNTMFGGSGTVSPTSPSRIALNLASNNNGAIYISNFANGIALNMSAGGMSISSNASTDEFRYNAVLQIGGVVGNSSYLNVSSNTLTNASTIVFNINNPSINNTTGTT